MTRSRQINAQRAHNFIDHTGQTFGRLLVVECAGKRESDGFVIWKCRCECGKEVVVVGKQLRRGQTKSCGCLMVERVKAANTTHGMKGTRIYRIWSGMLNRCRNSRDKDYSDYGGRGIAVCQRWANSFETFLADMGLPPSGQHSLDREQVNGNYEPGNCRWATPTEQARNRRNSVIVEHSGISMTCAEWDQSRGFPQGTIARRIRKGWSVNDAIETRAANKKELAVA